jgi:transposase
MLDDFVVEDSAVRVIDVFVDELGLRALGFAGVDPQATGRPAYHPSILLKLYIYGYINRVQSSGRLEREAQRNIELMWLIGRLTPDFKTIADFRKDNGKAIRRVCSQFVVSCRQLNLFSEAIVAIDGSKFKAVNNRDRNFTRAKMKRRMEQIEESIDRYLSRLDTADRQEPPVVQVKVDRLRDKISALKEEMQRLKELEVRMLKAPDKQISLTDPDARSMATSGKGTGMVGYNVQTAVEATHHLIVAHEVTNVGHDRGQLSSMAQSARDASGIEELMVVADRGYFDGEEILACEEAGITTFLPKPQSSGSKADGRFGKQDFVYIAKDDEPPSGGSAIDQARDDNRGRHDPAQLLVFAACPMKAQCTTGKERRVKRWEHEAVIEAMQARLDRDPEKMRVRRQTVEHPYGTIKAWMGATHFLTKMLGRVTTEMSLHVLAYTLKRVTKILGT